MKYTDHIDEVTQALQRDFPAQFPAKPLPKLLLPADIAKKLYGWAERNHYSHTDVTKTIHFWRQGKRWEEATETAPDIDEFQEALRTNIAQIHDYCMELTLKLAMVKAMLTLAQSLGHIDKSAAEAMLGRFVITEVGI